MGYHVRDGHLKRLILKGLKYIPESIGNLSHLENLNVDCFHLKILPDSILNLNSLRILSLMECANLQTIPEEIGLLINLEELHLTGFDSQIPESIGNLENLKILNIFSMSKLKNLPESMGNLKSLEILQFIGDSNCSINLRNIPIKELPRSIRRLKSLKVLNLMGCKSLEWIPEELSELESLETLNLGEYDKELILIVKGGHPIHSWSEIRSLNRKAILLPKNFGNLKNLKHLTLSFWKNLKSLPESIGQLDSLEVLNLCYCDSLNSLPKSMRNLKKVKNINLRGCKLINSLPETFELLDSLESINLTHCNFKEIPSSLIRLNKFLSLDLSGNPLDIKTNQISMKIMSKVIDTLPIIPNEIYRNFLNNKISREEASNQLKLLIESTDSPFVKTRCIEFLEEGSLDNENIFEVLKDLVFSEKNKYARTAAVNALVNLFPKKSIKTLQGTVINNKSALVIISLFHVLDQLDSDIKDTLKTQILERYATIFDVCIEEARVFLDLQEISIKGGRAYDIYDMVDRDLEIGLDGMWYHGTIYDLKHRLPGESHVAYAVSKDGHVRGINLDWWGVDEIPESIGLLSKLRYLSGQGIRKIPKSLNNLPRLNDLNLNGKALTHVPDKVLSIAKKRYLWQYLNEGVDPSEAHVLGLLDIMNLYDFYKLEKEEKMYEINGGGALYKINNNGHITCIYIWSETGPNVGAFPDTLCSLKYLKELCLAYCDIEIIPESIGNLKSLELLDLSGNFIKNIPDSIFKLKNLKYLILDENPIPNEVLNRLSQSFTLENPYF